MSGPYQGRDLSNCGVGRLRVAINCGVLSVKALILLVIQLQNKYFFEMLKKKKEEYKIS